MESRQRFALKQTHTASLEPAEQAAVLNELRLLASLHHPNVLQACAWVACLLGRVQTVAAPAAACCCIRVGTPTDGCLYLLHPSARLVSTMPALWKEGTSSC